MWRSCIAVAVAAAALLAMAPPTAALHAYGHAYSRPHDFSDAQIAAIASRFEVFTVEKATAANVYGKKGGIAATVGTAKRIQALNNSVKVLMYWNAALHYDLYECESEVQPSWVFKSASHAQPYYNYSVPAFREWWVTCAVHAFWDSVGHIDGFFLDATPKVASGQNGGPGPADLKLWSEMVDELKARLGPGAIVIDNGFFLAGKPPHNKQLAGADAWVHTGASYAESMASIGDKNGPEQDIAHLRWLANASAANPGLELIGHGKILPNASSAGGALDPVFEFGLAKYMLVTASMERGWFLANSDYSIDGGVLAQPQSVYTVGLGCGEPTAAFKREGKPPSNTLLTRSFEHGTVAVDFRTSTATIRCGAKSQRPALKMDDGTAGSLHWSHPYVQQPYPWPYPSVERWGLHELAFTGPAEAGSSSDAASTSTSNIVANPFEVELSATFTKYGSTESLGPIAGFFDGGTTYRVRFSPPTEGSWCWRSRSSEPLLDGRRGCLTVTPPRPGNHGPVESHNYSLRYADGTPHYSSGTTCYQWASKSFAMQNQTLETLRTKPRPFNKIRMTLFPKWYVYNHANPVDTGAAFQILAGSPASNSTAWGCVGTGKPCSQRLEGSFDLRRFNVSFWQNYERLLTSLGDMGVIADVIVFHPYDNGHWGFDCLGGRNASIYNTTNDSYYLKYLAARFAAFSNVWWSMANEWSFVQCKSRGINTTHLQSPSPIWDELFETLSAADPYKRQMSIHNGNLLYNHSRPWITHVSLQSLEDRTPAIRAKYGKPVIWDEEQYEGNISADWGRLSGAQEVDRFWWGASLGVFAGHSETLLHSDVHVDDDQPLWWAKGGTLIGQSPRRIAWLRSLQGVLFPSDLGSLTPTQEWYRTNKSAPAVANMLSDRDVGFKFLHFMRNGSWTIRLGPPQRGKSWHMHRLDYWAMTQHTALVNGSSVTIEVTTESPHKPTGVNIVLRLQSDQRPPPKEIP